jgi:alanine racemase
LKKIQAGGIAMNCLTTWAEIDLGAIAHNMREVRRITGAEPRIMAVVKANAYGHGAVEVARVALEHGADFLGVARAHEGAELRKAGIGAPILVFGYSPPECFRFLVDHELMQTVYSLQLAEAFSEASRAVGKTLKVHLKIDTGMGRLGLLPGPVSGNTAGLEVSDEHSFREAAAIAALPGLELEGIYTHFAAADSSNKESARGQLERFLDFLEKLKKQGVEVPIRHAANSAAVIDLPETHLDMVRPGIMLYGLYPSEGVDKTRVSLKPAMQLKARVAHVKSVPASFKVSYASTYQTPQPTRIATVAIGYADGYSRLLSSRGVMLVHGQRVPVVGRVTMDQTMLDVGHIAGVKTGDEVIVFGRQGDECIGVEELAGLSGTINYEVVSTITARVPRL